MRAATPADVDEVHSLFESLSLDDRFRRFFCAFRPRHDFVAHWIAAAERGGCSVVVALDDPACVAAGLPQAIVAEAGFAILPDGSAELALTVAHPWRGWLGPYLLDVLVEEARRLGVAVLEAEVLTANTPMRALLTARGAVVLDRPDWNVVRLAVALDGAAEPVVRASRCAGRCGAT